MMADNTLEAISCSGGGGGERVPAAIGKDHPMGPQQVHRASTTAIIVLSLTALLDVLLVGFTQPPQADEGTAAHIFQLAILALVPTGLLFLATAEWNQPRRIAQRLAFPAAAVVLAFAALYYLEHHFYRTRY